MSLRERTRPELGIIEPCLPSPAKAPPSGPGWLHEIKHDGVRIMARRDGAGVRLITRHGNDFTARFPLVASAAAASAVMAAKRPRSFAPSTYWNSTERICADARLRSEKTYWQNCSTIQTLIWASYSTSITRKTALLYFARPAVSVARAL